MSTPVVDPDEAFAIYRRIMEDLEGEQAPPILLVLAVNRQDQPETLLVEMSVGEEGIQPVLIHAQMQLLVRGLTPVVVVLFSETWMRHQDPGGNDLALNEAVLASYADHTGYTWTLSRQFTRTNEGLHWHEESDVYVNDPEVRGGVQPLLLAMVGAHSNL